MDISNCYNEILVEYETTNAASYFFYFQSAVKSMQFHRVLYHQISSPYLTT